MKAIRQAEMPSRRSKVAEPEPVEGKGAVRAGGTVVLRTGGGDHGVISDPIQRDEPKKKRSGMLLGVGGGAVLAAVLGLGWFYAAKPKETKTETLPVENAPTIVTPAERGSTPPQPAPIQPRNVVINRGDEGGQEGTYAHSETGRSHD